MPILDKLKNGLQTAIEDKQYGIAHDIQMQIDQIEKVHEDFQRFAEKQTLSSEIKGKYLQYLAKIRYQNWIGTNSIDVTMKKQLKIRGMKDIILVSSIFFSKTRCCLKLLNIGYLLHNQ